VTGDRRGPQEGIKEYLQKVREYCPGLPLALGFGIDGPEKVKEVITDIDGIIIGSALINIINSHDTEEGILKNVSSFINDIKRVL
ncbi:MAG: tryptophan synthase subunit alpha, partial [Halanaerobiales bacterium]